MEHVQERTTNGQRKDDETQDIANHKEEHLHWDPNRERRGLGDLITKANHIGITVSDVGRSLWFYTDILGLQQIRRPNFDRHGAWLTMGNIELHLLLGEPRVPEDDHLIVGHISLESQNIHEVLKRLKQMNIPFQTNTSVPKGGAQEKEGVVTQFFLRDPDGYCIELCNCDILTEFCLGDEKVKLEGYEESGKMALEIETIAKISALAYRAKRILTEKKRLEEQIAMKFDAIDGSGVVVDEEKLRNLVKRTKVWGDVVQGETEESLRVILQKTDNDVPRAIDYIKAKHGAHQIFQPPPIYPNNEEEFMPAAISMADIKKH